MKTGHEMDRYPRVYDLSKRYGPPGISLRDAEILDAYGDESGAPRPINHCVPEDVSLADLDFYGWVYSFMGFRDLLFYLYPIAREYEKDHSLDCVDSFFYSLDRLIPEEAPRLPEEDRDALIAGLNWMWFSGDAGYADWVQCPNLQKVIGVTASWEDLQLFIEVALFGAILALAYMLPISSLIENEAGLGMAKVDEDASSTS